MTINEWLQKKGEAVKAYRDLLGKAESEQRELSADEQRQCDAWEKEIEDANAAVAKIEAEKKRRDFLALQEESLKKPVLPGGLSRAGNDGGSAVDNRTLIQKIRDYQDEGLTRAQALDRVIAARDDRAVARREYLSRYFRHGLYGIDPGLQERAALQMDNDAQAGFLMMPEQFIARLIQDLDRTVAVRGLATVIPLTGGESLGAPSLETDIADSDWTTELGVGTEDSALAFGRRRLTPHPLAKRIKVSKDLLAANNAISPEAIVRERMSYKFATVQETAFMTGSGAGQPLGVFTASTNGISTTRDVSTGNTTTSITTDGLIECKYSLESQWMNSGNLRWIFHRSAVKQIRKLKDGDGQYVWQPGIVGDATDRLLGIPVIASEYAPSTFTTGLYVGILGDFSYYWIADSMSLSIQRLVELYAATNQDGFFGRMRLDGMPVLQTAFARVKLA